MANERSIPPISVQGHVLDFDLKTGEGILVIKLNISYRPGFFRMEFNRSNLCVRYRYPAKGDRVAAEVKCGQDSLPWYVMNDSLRLICRAPLIKNSNAS